MGLSPTMSKSSLSLAFSSGVKSANPGLSGAAAPPPPVPSAVTDGPPPPVPTAVAVSLPSPSLTPGGSSLIEACRMLSLCPEGVAKLDEYRPSSPSSLNPMAPSPPLPPSNRALLADDELLPPAGNDDRLPRLGTVRSDVAVAERPPAPDKGNNDNKEPLECLPPPPRGVEKLAKCVPPSPSSIPLFPSPASNRALLADDELPPRSTTNGELADDEPPRPPYDINGELADDEPPRPPYDINGELADD